MIRDIVLLFIMLTKETDMKKMVIGLFALVAILSAGNAFAGCTQCLDKCGGDGMACQQKCASQCR